MMEFSVKRNDLLEELDLTQGVVERKTTIPILSNLLFESKGDQLLLTATDLELSICYFLRSQNQEGRQRHHSRQEVTGARALAAG